MARTRIAELPPFADATSAPEARMHWVQVPFSVVETLYDEGTLKVQRHHLRGQHEARVTRPQGRVHARLAFLVADHVTPGRQADAGRIRVVGDWMA